MNGLKIEDKVKLEALERARREIFVRLQQLSIHEQQQQDDDVDRRGRRTIAKNGRKKEEDPTKNREPKGHEVPTRHSHFLSSVVSS